MLTIPLISIGLSLFVLGSVLVCWAVDRHFPMNNNSKGGRS
ncbi:MULTISPECIES: hypothetical protein [unclassified Streptomyces]